MAALSAGCIFAVGSLGMGSFGHFQDGDQVQETIGSHQRDVPDISSVAGFPDVLSAS